VAGPRGLGRAAASPQTAPRRLPRPLPATGAARLVRVAFASTGRVCACFAPRRRRRWARYEPEAIYDYRYVLHDVQLNRWVIAWIRRLGDRLLDWRGETTSEPPRGLRAERPLRLEGTYWSVERVADARPRPVRPDAVSKWRARMATEPRFFIDYDRTGRPDKNLEKFRRYDSCLCCEALTRDGFRQVTVDRETGTVTWPGGADLAPNTLYERVRTGISPDHDVAA
jgi:hypothetical protein